MTLLKRWAPALLLGWAASTGCEMPASHGEAVVLDGASATAGDAIAGAAADATADESSDGADAREASDGRAASDGGVPASIDATLDAPADVTTGEGAAPTRDGGLTAPPEPAQIYALTVTAVDPTFVTEDHFIAGVEMQIAGEPFAQAMGRDLAGFSRDYACLGPVCSPSVYHDPAAAPLPDGGASAVIDLPGFSSAVESYEYSKQPMNNVAFESGAGTSLLFGPVLNPTGATGAAALQIAEDWFSHIAGASNSATRFVKTPSANDPLGWPGLWPTLQPFTSFRPTIQPTHGAGCTISSDDNPGVRGALTCEDYECDYTSLHLVDRAAQVSSTIGPGATGWFAWKEALWTLNYLQLMHDVREAPVMTVNPAQLANVGIPGNAIVGTQLPGTYLGSSDIEGFQAGNFIQMLDNQTAQWLLELTTTDGAALGGFSSLAAALAYAPTDPLRWFPAAIQVTEVTDASGFPAPSGYAIKDPGSSLLDLAGMLGGYATAYALTDRANAEVGGSQPVRVYFDGDPFPVQNQIPDGEPTLHDRSLAMVRVLVVDMDRIHLDPSSGLFVDHADLGDGSVSRGATLSTDVAAYTLLSLRTARRALDSELALYSNTKPDAQGVPSPLDSFPPVDGAAFGARLDALIGSLADAFYDRLTTADGHAYAGWNVAAGAPAADATSLDAHTAAVRGLMTAYLATGATKFRDRALAVFQRVEDAFYDPAARVYRPTEGDRSPFVTFTPRRFGLLQASLRDTYELVAVLPGNAALAALIERRVARLNKLVLNGWDDRDEDQVTEWPSECAQLGTGPDGQPLGLGALQMAERVLTGESGSTTDSFDAATRVVATDREHDCVPEISAVGLPSALASSVTFALTPWTPANAGQVPRDGGWVTP
ncbi:MAG: hypothetical protein JOZ69_20615 [Myxococcales bacterium]|nr:hypothetical protein [Myxococcales bacterium]